MTSGRNASTSEVIGEVEAELERAGLSGVVGDPRNLRWHESFDRSMAREDLGGLADEAILPGFGPEGHGGNAREDCGEAHPFVCDSCGHSVEFGRTCGQSVCTRCGVAWTRDLAIKKAAKLRRVRKEKDWNTPDSEHQKFHHTIISPPLQWYANLAQAGCSLQEAQQRTKEVVKSILDEMRAQGVVMRHSFRGKDEDGGIASESDDRGEWKQRLNSDREWFGDVRDELAWKPHYHCLVVADYVKTADFVEEIEEETGWVIHRISDDDGVSIPNDGAMARVLTYGLSHCDIDVREDAHNRSACWEVGSFQGDPIKSSSRFSATPSDLSWADSRVRDAARDVLGLRSGSTKCGVEIPPVDDPDELARNIIEELYPDHDEPQIGTDTVLYHLDQGHIRVDVSTSSGGGGSVTVRDAFGEPIGEGGWGGELPPAPETTETDPDVVATTIVDEAGAELDQDDCDCDDHDDQDDDRRCDGQLIPLEEARDRGLLDDDEWLDEARHVQEALEADREWPDDLDPWITDPPAEAIGAG